MLFTLLLTALTATSGEDTHTTVRGGALAEGKVCPDFLQVKPAVAVRKRGQVSLGQEDTQQGKVRGRKTLHYVGHIC